MWLLRYKYFIIVGLFVFGLLLMKLLVNDLTTNDVHGYDIPKVVSYSFSVKNSSGTVTKNVDFWTYAPVKLTSFQKVQDLEVSHPYTLLTDDIGNQIIHIHFDYIGPYSEKIINIQSILLMAKAAQYVPISNENIFLSSEAKIQVSHPEIQKVASQYQFESLIDFESLYQWVSTYIKALPYVAENMGALYALEERKGDCPEYATLMPAVLRAQGIPARVLGGFIMEDNGLLKSSAYHNWAEFYFDGAWHLADPQMKTFETKAPEYIMMTIISEKIIGPMGRY